MIGARPLEAYARMIVALALGPRGAWGDALAHEALRIASDIGHEANIASARWALGALCLNMLDLDEARRQLEQGLALIEGRGAAFLLGHLSACLARVQIGQVEPAAAERVLGALQTASSGAYYSFEVISPPGLGIPPHVHSREDEVIYVVEGEYEIFLGGKIFRAGPGSVLNFARGTAHGFQNVGAIEGRTLWVVTPGASFEQFFHELAQVPPGPPDVSALAALFGRYGMELLPPPGL